MGIVVCAHSRVAAAWTTARAAATSSGAATEGARPREAAIVGSAGVATLGSSMVSRERGEQQAGEAWTGWALEEGVGMEPPMSGADLPKLN
jgi:hypothetical protein